ncbi:4Fe-4S dicluster domain-containing protein [Halarsenatibacter silvermanii]|uniref:Heterodisulfide reductase subunit C n=1 Tax=Halarsenatibacter silvermanii TaxID=321763 RepID=A0A1G9I4C2_9FIRM|nr:4Fe-4S dicluster domain-containing protein [Halarsenatibacter silvermanii]SDL19916.1 heterodisulfide reductase subunit C [Halarsenatibacter silvermanii]
MMNSEFKRTVQDRPGGENLSLCFSCGSCTGTCPVAEQRESFNPRLMIKKALLGFEEELLDGEEIWQCIQCRRCVSACPQNVRFADIVRVLRRMAVEEDYCDAGLEQELDELDKNVLRYRLNSVEEALESDRAPTEYTLEETGGE